MFMTAYFPEYIGKLSIWHDVAMPTRDPFAWRQRLAVAVVWLTALGSAYHSRPNGKVFAD